MKNENSIVSEIFKDIPFSKREIDQIDDEFEEICLKKGNILLKSGKKVENQYFIHIGCLRAFFIDSAGKEHTVQFAIKDWWISDYTAFFTNTQAIMSIECLQDATIYKISKKSMENLYLEIPQLETFFRKKMEKAFARFQKRILGNLSQSAQERYATFVKTYPNIELTVKNYHIASYLGITTESLSRIRKKIVQK